MNDSPSKSKTNIFAMTVMVRAPSTLTAGEARYRVLELVNQGQSGHPQPISIVRVAAATPPRPLTQAAPRLLAALQETLAIVETVERVSRRKQTDKVIIGVSQLAASIQRNKIASNARVVIHHALARPSYGTVAIGSIEGSQLLLTESFERRAIWAAECVLHEAHVYPLPAHQEYMAQMATLGGEEGMTGAAGVWSAAQRAANAELADARARSSAGLTCTLVAL